jgi:hypothetical protein
MKAGAVYLVAHALVAVPGLPVLWVREVGSWSLPARAAATFAVGAIVLAAESTLSTMLGVAWNPLIVLAPPLLLAIVLARNAREKAGTVRLAFRPGRGAAAFGILVGGAAVGHLALSLATARATSTDFLLFWGVKALHFAGAKGVDPALLRHAWFSHGQPFYPPLVPTLDAWGVLAAGHMPWRMAPLVTVLWFVASALLVLEIQRRRFGDRSATLVAAFWMAALSASLVVSFSGANAEAPLLLYETAAGMLLLTEGPDSGAGRRLLAGIFLAGAVLTKVEGTVGSSLLIFGTVLRDFVARRPLRLREAAALVIPPLSAGLLWWSYLRRFDISANYAAKGRLAELHWDRLGELVGLLIGNLKAGTWWLAWTLPILVILAAAGKRRYAQALPGIVAVAGLLAFFLFIYLHETTSQAVRISWEIPRTSQPALSLLIAVAAVCYPPGKALSTDPNN